VVERDGLLEVVVEDHMLGQEQIHQLMVEKVVDQEDHMLVVPTAAPQHQNQDLPAFMELVAAVVVGDLRFHSQTLDLLAATVVPES